MESGKTIVKNTLFIILCETNFQMHLKIYVKIIYENYYL